MLIALLLSWVLTGQVDAAASVGQMPGAAQAPASQPVVVSVATTQVSASTTQPIQVIVQTEGAKAEADRKKSLYETFLQSKIGEVFEGKRSLTWDDVKNPIFWFDIVRDFALTILAFIPRLLGTMVFLCVFWVVYRAIRKLAVRSMKKGEVDSSIRDMLATLIKWCVMGFGIVIACNQLGIPIVAMLTGVSIIGLAVGFAAQETLANFIAGIVIFLDKPFKVGDWIEMDGQQGAVSRVTFRSTRFTNLDGDVVVIPNTVILSTRIINKSTNPITRVNVPIGIAYKESIDRARDVLLATLEGDERIETTRAAEVIVKACGASSVDLVMHFWIREERYEDAMVWEYLEKSKKALDAAGVEIPFPHVQVLMEKTPALDALAGARRVA
jgi:small conductance mechanosensitive channel